MWVVLNICGIGTFPFFLIQYKDPGSTRFCWHCRYVWLHLGIRTHASVDIADTWLGQLVAAREDPHPVLHWRSGWPKGRGKLISEFSLFWLSLPEKNIKSGSRSRSSSKSVIGKILRSVKLFSCSWQFMTWVGSRSGSSTTSGSSMALSCITFVFEKLLFLIIFSAQLNITICVEKSGAVSTLWACKPLVPVIKSLSALPVYNPNTTPQSDGYSRPISPP